jgi:hypothetical protein
MVVVVTRLASSSEVMLTADDFDGKKKGVGNMHVIFGMGTGLLLPLPLPLLLLVAFTWKFAFLCTLLILEAHVLTTAEWDVP